MSEHYFSAEPGSEHRYRTVKLAALGVEVLCETDAGVFSRDGLDEGSRILLEAVGEARGDVLDLGCGWGAVGAILGKRYPGIRLTLSDVNRRALDLARENLRRNGVSGEVVLSDGFDEIDAKFDAILTNPPIRAGKKVVYRLLEQAGDHLKEDGRLCAVIRKQQGAPSAVNFLKERYPRVEILRRSKGYWVIEARK